MSVLKVVFFSLRRNGGSGEGLEGRMGRAVNGVRGWGGGTG